MRDGDGLRLVVGVLSGVGCVEENDNATGGLELVSLHRHDLTTTIGATHRTRVRRWRRDHDLVALPTPPRECRGHDLLPPRLPLLVDVVATISPPAAHGPRVVGPPIHTPLRGPKRSPMQAHGRRGKGGACAVPMSR